MDSDQEEETETEQTINKNHEEQGIHRYLMDANLPLVSEVSTHVNICKKNLPLYEFPPIPE